jgi:hypothetical protein
MKVTGASGDRRQRRHRAESEKQNLPRKARRHGGDRVIGNQNINHKGHEGTQRKDKTFATRNENQKISKTESYR